MLRSGAERIYGFGEPWEWDGRWLLVVLRVPEERREVRHQMRTRLAWAGFGSLGGGLWITPHAEREAELADVAGDGSAAELCRFRAELGALGEPARVVADAWDLDASPTAYRAFVDPLRPHAPARPGGEFRRPDAARPRVAQVPVPRSGPAGGDAPGPLAARGARTSSSTPATRSGRTGARRVVRRARAGGEAPGARSAA